MKKSNEIKSRRSVTLIINSLGRGGAERVCVSLANELTNRGNRVNLIVLRKTSNNYESDLDNRIKIEYLDAKKDIFSLIKLKRYLLINNNIERILAFDERITSICNYVKIKENKNYKVITRIINNIDYQKRYNNNLTNILMERFVKKYFKYSDKYIFQCRQMMLRMVKYFNIKQQNSKSTYIYNPLSEYFENQRIESRKSDFFLMVGRLDKQKGYKYALSTFRKLKQNGINIHVIILGEGPYRKKIEKYVNKYKLNVELLGNIKHVDNYYAKARALILTSIYEGFPNVEIEAMACGCPVISFDCPTGPSEIINKNNGMLSKYLDINELYKTIQMFNKRQWNYKEISENAKEKYNRNSIINRYIDVLFSTEIV